MQRQKNPYQNAVSLDSSIDPSACQLGNNGSPEETEFSGSKAMTQIPESCPDGSLGASGRNDLTLGDELACGGEGGTT